MAVNFWRFVFLTSLQFPKNVAFDGFEPMHLFRHRDVHYPKKHIEVDRRNQASYRLRHGGSWPRLLSWWCWVKHISAHYFTRGWHCVIQSTRLMRGSALSALTDISVSSAVMGTGYRYPRTLWMKGMKIASAANFLKYTEWHWTYIGHTTIESTLQTYHTNLRVHISIHFALRSALYSFCSTISHFTKYVTF